MSLDSVALRIKAKREHLQLTQSELARAAGVSRSAATQWELGISHPSFEKTVLLSRLLKCTPEWIAFGVETARAEECSRQVILKRFGSSDASGSNEIQIDEKLVAPWNVQTASNDLAFSEVGSGKPIPPFNPRDLLLVSLSGWQPFEGGYYYVDVGQSPRLVHLDHLPDQMVALTFGPAGGAPITQILPRQKVAIRGIVRALLWRQMAE